MANQTLAERRQMRVATIEKYLASNLTQKQFCEQEQLTYSTFQLWLKKYRQTNGDSENARCHAGNNFVPLTFKPLAVPSEYTIEYPNGVVLRVSSPIDLATLIRLIQASGV